MKADAATPLERLETDWDALVREHSGRVFGLAYRLTGNRADAEDLTQEVFVRALRSSGVDRRDLEPERAEGWWHRVTTNLFLDLVRRRRRTSHSTLDDHPGRVPADTAADPGTLASSTTLDDDVEAALAALPLTYREAVVAHDVHGLSYAEIGVLVGAKPGTVRSRIHRGRRMLRAALAHRAPTPGRTRHGGPAERAAAGETLAVAGHR